MSSAADPGAEPATDAVATALLAGNARYARALATSDADELVALFEPGGAIVDATGRDAAGHDGLREMAAYGREQLRDVSFEIAVAWTKVDPLDPAVAYAAGDWRMSYVPAGGPGAGEMVRAHGRFAETWHLADDGTWRIHRDLTLSSEDG